MRARYLAALVFFSACGGADQLVVPPPAPPPTPPPAPSEPVRLEVRSLSATVMAGGFGFVDASPRDRDGRLVPKQVITWISRSPEIATVEAGVVLGVAFGRAVIVATLGALQDSVSIDVVPAALRITPGKDIALYPGDAVTLGVTWMGATGAPLPSGPPLAWTNWSPERIALTVPGDGRVVTATAREPGHVILTVAGGSVAGSVAVDIFELPADGTRPVLVVNVFEVKELVPDYYGGLDGEPTHYAPRLRLAMPGSGVRVEVVRVAVTIEGIGPLQPVCSSIQVAQGAIREVFGEALQSPVVWVGLPFDGMDRTAVATISYRVDGGAEQQLTVRGPVLIAEGIQVAARVLGGWSQCS